MVILQLLDEVNAEVYPVSLEFNEIESTTLVSRAEFAREVDQFGQGTPDLCGVRSIVSS